MYIAHNFWVNPWLYHLGLADFICSPLLKGGTLFFQPLAAQPTMCLMLVFPLLGPRLVAIQFTKQAEEQQKVNFLLS